MADSIEELVVLAQTGDGEAYARIVGRFEDSAFAYAYSVLGDAGLAEDARQEAFIDAYVDLLSLRNPSAFPGWFRRIVLNCALQYKRGRRLLTVPLQDAHGVASAHSSPARHAERNEAAEQVEHAIRCLPPLEEEAVRLFHLDGLSLKEIARTTGASSEAIRCRLHSARARLRQRLISMAKDTVLRQSRSGDKRPARAAAAEALSRLEIRLAKILRVPAAGEQQEAADMLCAAGRFHRILGHLDQALTAFQQGLTLASLRNVPEQRARFLTERGLTLLQEGDYASARKELAASRDMQQGREEHTATLAATLNGLGACAWSEGNYPEARRYFLLTRWESRQARCGPVEAEAFNNLALLDWKAGDLPAAIRNFQNALRRWKALDVKYGIALTLMNLGVAEENLGRTSAASRHYREARTMAEELGFMQVRAATLTNLGNLAIAAENWPEALACSSKALELAREIRDPRSEAIAQENLALAHIGVCDLERARKALRAARTIAVRIGDRERLLSLLLVEAEMIVAEGKAADAADLLAKADGELRAGGYQSELPRLLRVQGAALMAGGDRRGAEVAFRRALRECDRQKNDPERKRIGHILGDSSMRGRVSE